MTSSTGQQGRGPGGLPLGEPGLAAGPHRVKARAAEYTALHQACPGRAQGCFSQGHPMGKGCVHSACMAAAGPWGPTPGPKRIPAPAMPYSPEGLKVR